MKKAYPKCLQERYDCFAMTMNGRCDCLKDTDFCGRMCPFYKRGERIEPGKKPVTAREIETAVVLDGVMDEPIEIRREGGREVAWGYRM